MRPSTIDRYFSQAMVVIARRMANEAFGYFFMTKFGNQYPMARVLLVSDTDAKKFTNIIPFRKESNQLIQRLMLRG